MIRENLILMHYRFMVPSMIMFLSFIVAVWAPDTLAGSDHSQPNKQHKVSGAKVTAPASNIAPDTQIWGANYFPNFELTAHTGEKLRFFDDVIKDKVVSINFMFTTCTDICPMETARMREVYNLLADRAGKDVYFYSITIDPEHDTVEVLNEYSKRYSIDGNKWKFLTGSKKEIDIIRDKFGLYSNAAQEADLSNHNINMIIGNQATGQWVKRTPFENPHILANQLGSWMHNWKKVTSEARRKYDEAPELRQISRGEMLFRDKCTSCHVISGGYGRVRNAKPIGPDLFQVTKNRDRDWLKRWLADPKKMLEEKDPIAVALLDQYKIFMPNFQLDDNDIDNLIRYMTEETERLIKKSQSKKKL
ncbi:MAG: SCO family protein [Gammaproteobacteria bacterium]|nr:SCO family protein [Gammaproteobacteria bacterium]